MPVISAGKFLYSSFQRKQLFGIKRIEVEHPSPALKAALLTFLYLDVCKFATQINGCFVPLWDESTQSVIVC